MRFKKPNLRLFMNSNGSANSQYNNTRSRYTQNQSHQNMNNATQNMTGGKCSSGNKTQDMGNAPIVIDLINSGIENKNFRTALWTGKNLQLTVMTIPIGEDIGFEKHDELDQFIGVISGLGEVVMGKTMNTLDNPQRINQYNAIIIPQGTYHNIKNIGRTPLKLYSIYAPKAHPFGTVDITNPNKNQS